MRLNLILLVCLLPFIMDAQDIVTITSFHGNVKTGTNVKKLKNVSVGLKIKLSENLIIDKNAYAEIRYKNTSIPVFEVNDKVENIIKPFVESQSLFTKFTSYFKEMISTTGSEKDLKVYHLAGGVKGYGASGNQPILLCSDEGFISREELQIFWGGPNSVVYKLKIYGNDLLLDSISGIEGHLVKYDFGKIDTTLNSVNLCISTSQEFENCRTLYFDKRWTSMIDLQNVFNSSTHYDIQKVSILLDSRLEIRALSDLMNKIKYPSSDSMYERMTDFYLAKFMDPKEIRDYKSKVVKELNQVRQLGELQINAEQYIGLSNVTDIEYNKGIVSCISYNKIYAISDKKVEEVERERVLGFGSNIQLKSLSIVDEDIKLMDSENNFIQKVGESFNIEKKSQNENYEYLEFDGSEYYTCLTYEKQKNDTQYQSWSNKVVVVKMDGTVEDFGIFLSGIPKGIIVDGKKIYYLSKVSTSKEQYILKTYDKISKRLLSTKKVQGEELQGISLKDSRTILSYSNKTQKLYEYKF